MSRFTRLLREWKIDYTIAQEERGGTASGYRQYVDRRFLSDPGAVEIREAVCDAAKGVWEEQSRKKGPDLFDVAGLTIPEFLTRYAKDFFAHPDEDQFEKVHQSFAVVSDLVDHSNIHLLKAAQASAAAAKEAEAAQEALRRAAGDRNKRLSDVQD
jgi:hypothetical protein